MDARSFKARTFGFIATAIYIVVIVLLRWKDICQLSTMEIDKFSGFLAGVFGPLSFLWLILGYLQQQQELALNTEALRLQAQELKAAVEEQRHAVEQHKELVQVTKQQLEHEREVLQQQRDKEQQASRPFFAFMQGGKEMFHDHRIHFSLVFINSGMTASRVKFETNQPESLNNPIPISHWEASAEKKISWSVPASQVNRRTTITFECTSVTGERVAQLVELILRADNQFQLAEPTA